MHCHILPGVDDGAQSMAESREMLMAAKAVGISRIVCTSHVRDPYFKGAETFEKMWNTFYAFEDVANAMGIKVHMGFEVNHHKLMELGMDWVEVLTTDGTTTLLLELSTAASPSRFVDYERTIFELQARGCEVIIAHPERYLAIQDDIEIAENLVRMGCRLQASADFMAGGRFGHEKKPAVRMLKAGLYTFIASDAHFPKHYEYFAKAHERYGNLLRPYRA